MTLHPTPHIAGAARRMLRRPLLRALAPLAAATLLAGCAVQPNGKGGMLIGVDTAELFGTAVGSFRLQNGNEGTLRRDNTGAFSVKLGGSFRVVPLKNAIMARVARVDNIGSRTVVLLETQERNCAYKYELLAIEGTDVLHWSVGNCGDRPRVELAEAGQALYIDFPERQRLHRHSYTDGRLLNWKVEAPAGANMLARPFADAALRAPGAGAAPAFGGAAGDAAAGAGERVIPAPPHKADGTAATPAAGRRKAPPAEQGGGATRIAAAATRPPAPPPMSFPAQEIAPTRLDLRK